MTSFNLLEWSPKYNQKSPGTPGKVLFGWGCKICTKYLICLCDIHHFRCSFLFQLVLGTVWNAIPYHTIPYHTIPFHTSTNFYEILRSVVFKPNGKKESEKEKSPQGLFFRSVFFCKHKFTLVLHETRLLASRQMHIFAYMQNKNHKKQAITANEQKRPLEPFLDCSRVVDRQGLETPVDVTESQGNGNSNDVIRERYGLTPETASLLQVAWAILSELVRKK